MFICGLVLRLFRAKLGNANLKGALGSPEVFGANRVSGSRKE